MAATRPTRRRRWARTTKNSATFPLLLPDEPGECKAGDVAVTPDEEGITAGLAPVVIEEAVDEGAVFG
jgi:hypothetical protein